MAVSLYALCVWFCVICASTGTGFIYQFPAVSLQRVSPAEQGLVTGPPGAGPNQYRNWCQYTVSRTVSCQVQNGTETTVQRVFQGCRWPGPCPKLIRTLVRPSYKVTYRQVTALEWRCCPGFIGEQCRQDQRAEGSAARVPERSSCGSSRRCGGSGSSVGNAAPSVMDRRDAPQPDPCNRRDRARVRPNAQHSSGLSPPQRDELSGLLLDYKRCQPVTPDLLGALRWISCPPQPSPSAPLAVGLPDSAAAPPIRSPRCLPARPLRAPEVSEVSGVSPGAGDSWSTVLQCRHCLPSL
ncbi:Collagen alpha-1(XXVI) chain [Merluccius polli]|uniref:Collagen alpha-1(XXVI) chain n=1 Tax=Merluccius polli TaxID=89951 RepID=A0AA47MBY4_MERPO|nr:Collagen alpha-1(XXVI) chain [Merluccius polli]